MSVSNMQSADEIQIREARPDDCEQLIVLIQEFAVFEKMPNSPTLTPEILRRDGFGDEKLFRCFVVEDKGTLVGYAMYTFRYSSRKGITVALEDLFVTPTYRQKGIGVRLLKAVAKVAVARNCKRMDWVCLGWNESAKDFYKSQGAINLTEDQEFNSFRLCDDNLRAFAK